MRILVTAGPTREPIDPVRFISNRSSGKMGYAIAGCAAQRGHQVLLVSGPVALDAPDGVDRRSVTTAEDMLAAVHEALDEADVLIMAAAVADWRPKVVSPTKLKKAQGPPVIALERTPDILGRMRERKGRRVYVGFAAETDSLIEEAQRKLADKGLDLIVANDVSKADSGFDVDTNRVVLIDAAGQVEALPLMSKRDVAGKILVWVETHVEKGA